MSEKIQDYYQTVTTSPLNIPAPPSLCLCHFCLHPLYSPSLHLTIHQPLASVAPRCQRRGIPWSHSYWSNPSPRPPLTDGGPCHSLLGCCKQKREDNMFQPRMKIQSLPTNPHMDGKSGDYSSSIPFWMFRTKVCGSIHLKTNPMKYYGVFIWCFRWFTKLLQLLDTLSLGFLRVTATQKKQQNQGKEWGQGHVQELKVALCFGGWDNNWKSSFQKLL